MNKSEKRSYSKLIKIKLVGDDASGKTSLFNRIKENRFVESENNPTRIIDFASQTFQNVAIGEIVKIQLWDEVAPRFRCIGGDAYRGTHIVLFTCDTSTERFDFIGSINTVRTCYPSIKRVVLGTKMDIADKFIVKKARQYCEQQGLEFLQTSSKTGFGMDDLYCKICETS